MQRSNSYFGLRPVPIIESNSWGQALWSLEECLEKQWKQFSLVGSACQHLPSIEYVKLCSNNIRRAKNYRTELKAQGCLNSLAFPWMVGQLPSHFRSKRLTSSALRLAHRSKQFSRKTGKLMQKGRQQTRAGVTSGLQESLKGLPLQFSY